MLENLFFIKTENNNCYMFNRSKKLLNPIHPLVYLFAKAEEQKPELVDAFLSGDFDGIKQFGLPEKWFKLFKSEDTMSIYNDYKLMLKNHHYEDVNPDRLGFKLTAETVKHKIANLSQLTFEITDACNLKCKYCAYGELYSDKDERHNSYLSFEQAKMLIDYIVDYWGSPANISFLKHVFISFYGGEPLLNMDFIKETVNYINVIKGKNPNLTFTFAITTNGILLNKYIDYLAEHQFNTLVSLDGNQENNSYRIHHDNSECFTKVYHNLQLVKEKYPIYFYKHVNFNAVLHNRNSVDSIYTFFKNEFDKNANISALNDSGIRKEKEHEFWNMYQNVTASLQNCENHTEIERKNFIKMPDVQRASTFMHKNFHWFWDNYAQVLYDHRMIKRTPTGTCLPFGKKMFVTVNGKILACESIGQQYELGRLSDQNVELDFTKIADLYNGYYAVICKLCDRCYTLEDCIQCIFYLKPENPDMTCRGFVNKQFFEQYLVAQITYFENKPEMFSKIARRVIFG